MTTRTKIPPHSVEMEEALVGSMMLSGRAIEDALDIVEPRDLYVPALRRMFIAIECLFHEGAPTDPLAVVHALGAELRVAGGKENVLRVQAACPASANVEHYARVVAQLAAYRHAIDYAHELIATAEAQDGAALSALIREADVHDRSPFAHVDDGIDVLTLMEIDNHYDWLIEGLLERNDKVIITGGEGGGKSTLLRQFGALCACGMHPFTCARLPAALRVMYVDMENTDNQAARSFSRILHGPTSLAELLKPGMLSVHFRRQGANLATLHDQRWLEALVAKHHPQLLIAGPLYKAFAETRSAGKQSEEVAAATAYLFDRLSVKYGCALMLEGHAPHGDGTRDNFRPRGSSLWLGWPEFGIGLVTEKDGKGIELRRWRGDRERGRAWPHRLVMGGRVPYEQPFEDRPENLRF